MSKFSFEGMTFDTGPPVSSEWEEPRAHVDAYEAKMKTITEEAAEARGFHFVAADDLPYC